MKCVSHQIETCDACQSAALAESRTLRKERAQWGRPVLSVPVLPINEEDQRIVDRLISGNTPKGTPMKRSETPLVTSDEKDQGRK